jgi:methylated-DNA-protein-cysteine methyltransferase related protein
MADSFPDTVLAIVKSVPKGRVVSYGQVALMAGRPRAAREVGWILNQRSDDKTPWWRVINNSGRISIKHPEYSALLQKELLEKEGVKVSDDFEIDIEKYRMRD